MSAIKNWSNDDKPREKFMQLGKNALSDAELIAILIRSGSRKKNALDIGRIVLEKSKNDLNELAKQSVKELQKTEGIGFVKAITILAALELGGRREASEVKQKLKITSSKDIYSFLRNRLEDLNHEEFWVLTLNQANKVISEYKVGEGGISATVADPRKILKKAIEDNASGLILCHNHPSGNLKPSQQDISLTNKIKQACSFFDLSLLDHVIIGHKSYYSFADEGNI
ncbi:MAG: DNA repair protein RadC [Bacteroidetes bacterium]|nr:DNA repair protein RadC [Bacteroidota bacterium]